MSFKIENTVVNEAVDKSIYINSESKAEYINSEAISDPKIEVSFIDSTDGLYNVYLPNTKKIGIFKKFFITNTNNNNTVRIHYKNSYGSDETRSISYYSDLVLLMSTPLGWVLVCYVND